MGTMGTAQMKNSDLDLLQTHLAHWFSEAELEEIYDSDRPARYVAAELATQDFAFFARYYFPQYFRDEFASCHWDLFSDLQWSVTADIGRVIHLAESLPRGFGKSTIIAVAFPIWVTIGESDLSKRGKARVPHKHYIMIIKDSLEQAKLELAAIREELESNTKLKRDFGDLQGGTWTKTEITTANDVRIEVLGSGQKIRGRRYKQYRPDLIIGDDLENMQSVRSPTGRQQVKTWWSGGVEKAVDPKSGTIVNIGTMIHYDCLQAWVVERPGVRGRIYKALLEDATHQDMWDEWEILVTNLEDPDRERTARRFYRDNKVVMDEGAVVSWPQRFSYETLRLMKLGEKTVKGNQIKTFDAEMQNEPISDEDRLFQRISFFHIERDGSFTYLVPDGAGNRVDIRACKLVGACDPSLGDSHRGDFSALVDILVAPSNRMFVIWADIARRHPDRIIDAMRQRALYWAQQGMFYAQYGIETNQFQKLFASKAGLELLKSGIKLPVQEINSTHWKEARIDSLQPDLYNGYLLLYKEQSSAVPIELGDLYDQLWQYPMGAYVDGPDALEMARTIAAVAMVGKGPSIASISGRDAFSMAGGSYGADPFG